MVDLTAICRLAQRGGRVEQRPSFRFEQMALQQDLVLPSRWVLPDRSLRAVPSDARQQKA